MLWKYRCNFLACLIFWINLLQAVGNLSAKARLLHIRIRKTRRSLEIIDLEIARYCQESGIIAIPKMVWAVNNLATCCSNLAHWSQLPNWFVPKVHEYDLLRESWSCVYDKRNSFHEHVEYRHNLQIIMFTDPILTKWIYHRRVIRTISHMGSEPIMLTKSHYPAVQFYW